MAITARAKEKAVSPRFSDYRFAVLKSGTVRTISSSDAAKAGFY